MISILIPIYNFNVVKLVQKLKRQCDKLDIDYEILCFDDQSDNKYKKENNLLSDLFRVNYTELSENLGRARIRNWLVKSASYPYLLFLDCDTKVISHSFVKDYLEKKKIADVISGGRVYSKKPPRAYSKKLHWMYGTKKESKNAAYRSKYPIQYFHSNNFLAHEKVFKKIKFDESIQGYGYEDLLLAKDITASGFTLKHIDNPTEHLGLEKAKTFLNKTKNAIDNLLHLKYSDQEIPTNLGKVADRIIDLGMENDFAKFMGKRKEKMEANLTSKQPKMRYLDMYKLMYYLDKRRQIVYKA